MKKFYLLIAAAVLISCAILSKYAFRKPVAVKVVKPIVATVEDTVTATGRVYENSTKSLYAKGSGYIGETYVKVGDEVKTGDKIALFVRTGENSSDTDNSALPAGADVQDYLSQYGSSSGSETEVDAAAEEKVTLTAPADGVVTSLNTNSLDSKPVAIISDFSKLCIKASINESQISKVEEGQTVRITGEGFQGLIYTGTVSNISPVAKQVTTGTYSETVVETTVDIVNADLKIRPGFSVEINILTKVSPSAVVVPFETLTSDENGKDCVYIIENGKAIKKAVKTGLSNSYGTEITSGLDKNSVVVLNPPENLSASAFLTLKK